jgi:hypothetical protein
MEEFRSPGSEEYQPAFSPAEATDPTDDLPDTCALMNEVMSADDQADPLLEGYQSVQTRQGDGD